MRYLLYSFVLLLIAPAIFAGVFDIPSTDQSVSLLGVIFGASIGDIMLGGAQNPVLADLMEKFNFIIVVAGVTIISYAGILSVINTAHEGTPMGKNWSAIWIPMRSVIGMGLMVPAPTSGYSMIQVTVMWVIMQGIGAADALWTIALNGLAEGVSPSQGVQIVDTSMKPTALAFATQLLNAQTCMSALGVRAATAENVQANNGAGDWLAQNGTSVTGFAIPDAGTSGNSNPYIGNTSPPGRCKTAKSRYASMSGTYYFGVNNPSDPSAMSICGAVRVIGSVCASDYPTPTVPAGGTAPAGPQDSDLLQGAQGIYYTKVNLVATMLNQLQPIAQGIVSGQYTENLSGTSSNNAPPAGSVQQAADYYDSALSGLIMPPPGMSNYSFIGGNNAQAYGQSIYSGTTPQSAYLSTAVQDQINYGEQNGWVSAGSFYFVFNQSMSGQVYPSANKFDFLQDAGTFQCSGSCQATIPSCTSANCANGFQNGSFNLANGGVTYPDDLKFIANALAEANVYATVDTTPAVSGQFNSQGGTAGSQAASALSAGTSFNAGAVANMEGLLGTGSGEPLINIARFGNSLMVGVEAAILSQISYQMGLLVTELFPESWMALGNTISVPNISAFASGLIDIIQFMYEFFEPYFVFMWTFGAMLSIYLPLIPFMMFTMGVVGWLMVVIEAVIAGPIIALGIVMPAGDELGKLTKALEILANIVLRPTLMIFGFILSAGLFRAVLQLFNYGIGAVLTTVSSQMSAQSLFGTVAVMGAYSTFVIAIANQCFGLINAIPDKLLRWIGVEGAHTDTAAIGEFKGGLEKTGGEVAGSGPALRKGVQEATDAKAKARVEKQENAADTKANTANTYGVTGGKIGPPEGP